VRSPACHRNGTWRDDDALRESSWYGIPHHDIEPATQSSIVLILARPNQQSVSRSAVVHSRAGCTWPSQEVVGGRTRATVNGVVADHIFGHPATASLWLSAEQPCQAGSARAIEIARLFADTPKSLLCWILQYRLRHQEASWRGAHGTKSLLINSSRYKSDTAIECAGKTVRTHARTHAHTHTRLHARTHANERE
jgi:hypothetical protein